jgi:hypothetical protein
LSTGRPLTAASEDYRLAAKGATGLDNGQFGAQAVDFRSDLGQFGPAIGDPANGIALIAFKNFPLGGKIEGETFEDFGFGHFRSPTDFWFEKFNLI